MVGHLRRVLDSLPLPWTADTFAYVWRSIGAATLALWLGFELQLDSPFSAASTVLLLVHPVQGAVVGKGFNRMVGTLIGITAAFILLGMFAQQMLLFILGVGLWLGLCVAAMTVLRHYQSTAAVVAGYTVCLALGPAIVAPEQGFDHIVTRGTAVVIGVFSLSLIATLGSRKTIDRKLLDTLVDVSARAARQLSDRFAGEDTPELVSRRAQLSMDIGRVDDLLGIGWGESVLIRTRLPVIQTGLAQLQSAVMDRRLDDRDAAGHWLNRISTPLCHLGQALTDRTLDFTAAADRVKQLINVLVSAGSVDDLSAESARAPLQMERLREQLADLHDALRSFSSLERNTQARHAVAGFHRNYQDAIRNGIRALGATLVAGAVWYLSAWNQGPTLLAVLGPCCTLSAAGPDPVQGVIGFIKGTLYATLAAVVCKFLLMPSINGFPLLAVMLAMFWSFGIHATTRPRQALTGIAYLIAFNTLVSTGATAHYDFAEFINQVLAWFVAMGICLLAFNVVPKKPQHTVQALKQSLLTATRRLLRRGATLNHRKWQAQQQHRIVSLKSLLGADRQGDCEAGYLSLQLSRELARLQRHIRRLAPGSPIARCAATAIRRLAQSADHTAISAAQARRAAKSMQRLGAEQWAARYRDLAWLLEQYENATRPNT